MARLQSIQCWRSAAGRPICTRRTRGAGSRRVDVSRDAPRRRDQHLVQSLSLAAWLVEEVVNYIDSTFGIEYGPDEGCPETRGVLRPSVTCAGHLQR